MDQELKQFLADMETRINERMDTRMDAMETRINGHVDTVETRINERTATRMDAMEARLVETMRDMQTELLRGMASYAESINDSYTKAGSGSFQPQFVRLWPDGYPGKTGRAD